VFILRKVNLGIVFENRHISPIIALKKEQNWPNSPVFALFRPVFRNSCEEQTTQYQSLAK
jgi:hypothetical protein